jgi:tyrosyl-tRNA synthetase
MAMRLYTKADFYEELRMRGFQETAKKTRTHTIWLDPKGEPISVPSHTDRVPDHILDRLLETAEKLYHQECLEQKKYRIEHQESAAEIIDIKKAKKAD